MIACKALGLSSFIDTGTNICANISRIAIKIDKISSHQPFGVSNSPHPFNSVSKKADGILVVVVEIIKMEDKVVNISTSSSFKLLLNQ